MRLTATIANALWGASNAPAFVRYRDALRRPAEAQWALLRRNLAQNAECAYGQAHAFAEIGDYAEFTRRVPLVDYADIEPWIERIKAGEEHLLTSEPVTHLI